MPDKDPLGILSKKTEQADPLGILKKKADGQDLNNGGEAGKPPTPSPSPLQSQGIKWEENPLNPLAAANKAQAQKEQAQKVMPQPTPTIGKKAVPVKAPVQRTPITEVPEKEDGKEGFWSTASQALFAPLSGNYLKYFYNQILNGVEIGRAHV